LIRYIRVLGAALGGIVGITLIIEQIAVFQGAPGEGALAVAWVIAWTVLGFSLLPHLTVIPAMMAGTEFIRGCVAVPFARPAPTRELTLLRNPLRFESKAAAAFREEAAAAFLT